MITETANKRQKGDRENVPVGREHHNGAKEECPAGHAYTVENTYIDPRGSRRCRTCKRIELAEWKRNHG